MAEFQELVISLWASVGWNLNGWNVRVICNMFQLSAEHTWGNERGCGAIRWVHNRKPAHIKYIIEVYNNICTNTNTDEDTLHDICNAFQLSAEHTWGNERGCGAIRRDSAAQ